MISIAPDTHILESIRNQNIPRYLLLFELIDNAFDAGATHVTIHLSKTEIVVTDNGLGCHDLAMMFTMGKRRSHTSTQLGRYGIGFKDAAICLGDILTVTSIHRGVQRHLMCDWKRILNSGHWMLNDPIARETKDPSGTRISIEQLHHKGAYDKKSREALIDRIGLHYLPALEEGKQILLQTNQGHLPLTVPAYTLPPLEHAMQAELEVAGKRARVELGIIREGTTADTRGLLVTYGFRLIEKGYHVGNSAEPTPGLVGRLTLMPEWQLTKNKDKVHGLDKLDQLIEERFAPLIDMARTRGKQFSLNSTIKQHNDLFTDILAPNSRATRSGPHTKTGTILPTGTGHPHRRAQEIQPLGRLRSQHLQSKGLRIAWEFTTPANGPAHAYEAPGIIYLNANQPWIHAHMHDHEALSSFIVPVAATYLILRHHGQIQFNFMERAEDSAEKISYMTTYLLTCLLGNHDTPTEPPKSLVTDVT